jgi:hypothetical protein
VGDQSDPNRWPWALVEGALEAGGTQVEGEPDPATFKLANLLKCFTGRQTAYYMVESPGKSPLDDVCE